MQNTTVVNSKPASCVGCPYYDRPGPVWGEGSALASQVFVGIAPAEEEIKHGRVFAGGSGRILDRACFSVGVDRARAYTTNIVKCLVKPGEKVHYKAVQQCRPLLDQELNSLRNLKVITTLGEDPFHAFTGKTLTSVTNRKKPDVWLRGCPWPYGHHKVILPTFHPAYHARTGFVYSYQFEADLAKAARYEKGLGRFYSVKANYSPSDTEVREYVKILQHKGRGGLDIETPEDADEDELAAGGKPLPVDVIGLSAEPDEAMGVRPDQYHLISNLFTNRAVKVRWYVFNGGFDFYHLGKLWGELGGVEIRDCMLHLNVWRSDLRKKDLGILLSFFSDLPYTKNLAKVSPIKYQWADTCGVLEAGLNIEAALEFQGLLRVSLEQDHPLIEDLTNFNYDGLNRMRELGIHTDLKEVFKFLKVSQLSLAQYEGLWRKHFPHVDWTSPKQLGELFVGVFKLPVILKLRTKKKDGEVIRTKTPSCDVDALEEYRDKYNNKTADLVLKMRTIKHLGDFAGIIRPDTNRIHTGYAIHRQVQRRIQAFDPNIQTLPEEIAGYHTRRMVIPDNPDTDEIIAIDGSQCELRIYAYLAKAKNLLAAMEAGEYIYGTMYEQIFKRPYWKDPSAPHTKYNKADYVTPQELLAAKSGPLGFIYNRGWESLVHGLGMAEALAKSSYQGFHHENPEIQEFHKEVDKDVAKKGYQDNLWGARRYFPTPRIQRNEYLSFHGQSNWGELLRASYLIPAFRYLRDFGARVLLTVHDSMGINCPKRNSVAVTQFLFDHAEAPIPQMQGFVIPAEIKHGPNWADCKLFKTERVNGRTIVIE